MATSVETAAEDAAASQRSADLVQRHVVRGRLPGSRYVRIVTPKGGDLHHRAPGYVVARLLDGGGPAGRVLGSLRTLLIGRRLRSEQEIEKRVGTVKGLAVFASDNISSAAYATEEIMRVLTLERPDTPLPRMAVPHVLVPIARLDRSALHALAFARSISSDVTAVHVADDADEAERMRERWRLRDDGIALVVIESPYRALIPPLLAYVDARARQDPDRPVTIVLAEFVPHHFWEYVLHNQTALRLKLRLFFRPNTVVVDVPYHLASNGSRAEV